MEEIIMRTVLVKKQDIENMIEHLDKNYKKVNMILDAVEVIIQDEDWHLVDEATEHLAKCKDILKSYLK
jgi:hypothetical protein